MDFNVAYNNWMEVWLKLVEAVIEKQNPLWEVDDLSKAPDSIQKLVVKYNNNVESFRKSQWKFYESCPQALHNACKDEFVALKQAELGARHFMFTCTHCFETSQFYGQSMNLVEIINSNQTECWQTVINTVNRYRDMGFTVEVKYCAFASNSTPFDNSWGAYYIYINVNDAKKFLYASYPYETQDTNFMRLIYPPTLPIDNTHKAIYSETINL